jgi:hypothetical protein
VVMIHPSPLLLRVVLVRLAVADMQSEHAAAGCGGPTAVFYARRLPCPPL